MKTERLAAVASGWLAIVLPLILATGAGLTLAGPLPSRQNSASFNGRPVNKPPPTGLRTPNPAVQPARAAPPSVAAGSVQPQPMQLMDEASMFGPEQSGKPKEKATPEQKELKKKLADLAKKTTSFLATDGPLMKYNPKTNQIEPVSVDQYAQDAKKLEAAVQALSSKRLQADRLRKALGEVDEPEPEPEPELELEPEPEVRPEPEPEPELEREYDESVAQGPDDEEEFGYGGPMRSDEEPFDPEYSESFGDNYRQDSLFSNPPAERSPPRGPMRHVNQFGGSAAPRGPEDTFGYRPDRRSDFQRPAPFFDRPVEQAPMSQHIYSDDSSTDSSEFDSFEQEGDERGIDMNLIGQVHANLADRLGRISDLLYFSPEFLNQLYRTPSHFLTPFEREFKRMILCNSDEKFCDADFSQEEESESWPEDERVRSPSEHEMFRERQPAPDQRHGRHFRPPMPPMPPIPPMPPTPPMPPMPESRPMPEENHFSHSHYSTKVGPDGSVSVSRHSRHAYEDSRSHSMRVVSDGAGGRIEQHSFNGGPAQTIRRPAGEQAPQASPSRAQSRQPGPAHDMSKARPASAGMSYDELMAKQEMLRRQQEELERTRQQLEQQAHEEGLRKQQEIRNQARQPQRQASGSASSAQHQAGPMDEKAKHRAQQLQQLHSALLQ